MKIRLKEIGIGIGAIITYFFLNLIQSIPFEMAGVDLSTIPNYIKTLYLVMYEVLIASSLLLIFNKKIEKDLKDILKNHKEYYSKYIKYWLIGLLVMVISNSIIMFGFNNEMAGNEEQIRSLLKTNPLYIYLASVIFAPIIEELVFRQGIRNILGRNIIFILVSGFIFGGMHVVSNINSITDILFIIPYSSLGIAFAYMLYKTDNIFVSMGFHFMHNGLLVALQFLVLLFS